MLGSGDNPFAANRGAAWLADRVMVRCNMTSGLRLFWLAAAAGSLPIDGAAGQGPRDALHAAVETNTLQKATVPLVSDPLDSGIVTSVGSDPGRAPIRPQGAPQSAREPRGNPLWAIPPATLRVTRERPILLPSRRPPAPPMALPAPAPPPPPPQRAEPERPRLVLLGAVTGESESIAVFLDQTTKVVVRLRKGENHSGWILQSVTGREASLGKDNDFIRLALPAPDEASGATAASSLRDIRGVPQVPAAAAIAAPVAGAHSVTNNREPDTLRPPASGGPTSGPAAEALTASASGAITPHGDAHGAAATTSESGAVAYPRLPTLPGTPKPTGR